MAAQRFDVTHGIDGLRTGRSLTAERLIWIDRMTVARMTGDNRKIDPAASEKTTTSTDCKSFDWLRQWIDGLINAIGFLNRSSVSKAVLGGDSCIVADLPPWTVRFEQIFQVFRYLRKWNVICRRRDAAFFPRRPPTNKLQCRKHCFASLAGKASPR